MVFIKPELSKHKYKRKRQIQALFLEWVVDLETRTFKKTAGFFIPFFGVTSYVRHMRAVIKGVINDNNPT